RHPIKLSKIVSTSIVCCPKYKALSVAAWSSLAHHSPHTTHNGIPFSRKGDKVICKEVITIVIGDASFIVDGAPIARGGDVTSCGAKLIANQQSFAESVFDVMGIEQAEELRREAKEYFNESMDDYNLQFVMQSHNQNPLANKPY